VNRPSAQPADPVAKRPLWRRGWFIGMAALVVGFAIGAASAGQADTKNTASQPTSFPTATMTVTETPPVVTTTATATVTQAAPTEAAATRNPSRHPAAAAGGNAFTMPDEVGANLQIAQDAVQAASGNPFYYSGSVDASGDSRMQILDADWAVCTQSPAAGASVAQGANVTFSVVRVSESCP
jgi:hypothetical protein